MDGRPDGRWTNWGKVFSAKDRPEVRWDGLYERGARHGYATEDVIGRCYGCVATGVYCEQRKHGMWTTTDGAGKERGKGNYRNGHEHGKWDYWGDLHRTTEYDNGREVTRR